MATTTMREGAGYSTLQIALHWIMAILICFNYFASDGMPEMFDATMEGKPVTGWVAPVHAIVGLAVLALVLARLIVRLTRGVPSVADTAPGVMALAARVSHLVQYVLLFIVPVLGAITWYGMVDATADYHVYAVNLLMIVVLVHALAALFHQFVLRDGTLVRMISPR